MEELLKCKTCGGNAEVKLDPFSGMYFASCRSCGKTARESATQDYAARDWNKINKAD
ncbi:MAG: hypothetical protein LBI36_02540 [Oscillospiraceae bacterium]|jgi:uncharacterized Zn finger protein|nr:hypothetical protein [Oscillospiraceae bacterium]